jgi:hypothetical protein
MEIIGGINISGSYNRNNRDVINDTSNYILNTSNILVSRINATSNTLFTSINTKQNTINSTANQIIIGNGNGVTTTSSSLTFTNNDTLNAPKFVGNGSGLTNLPSASQWAGTNPIYYTAGNVGIGTTNPANELHIFDSTAAETSLIIQNNRSTIGTPLIELIRGTSGDTNTDYKIGNYNGNLVVKSSISNTDTDRLTITSGIYTTELAIQSISQLPSVITSSPVATTGTVDNDRFMIFYYSTDTGGTGLTEYTITLGINYNVDLLVVGGGGGGGQGNYENGGGGGGGVVYIVEKTLAAGTYKVIVGKGGGAATTGYDSRITLNGSTINVDGISVIGKGGGAAGGGWGGSGAGGNKNGGAGSATQGNTFWNGSSYVAGGFNGQNGGAYNGGGGGGAGEAGGTDGGLEGGDGRAVNITGTNTFYGGGGAGGGYGVTPGGDGGGGGTGNWGSGGGAAAANTGGGGGGAYNIGGGPGGAGGSGIVIIRYRQTLPQIETSINLVRGTVGDTMRDYKIGNFGGDLIIKSSIIGVDTDYFKISSTGAITNPTGTASWNTGSDRRIKENIARASYDKCYENIEKLELNRFNYIKGYNTVNKDITQLGFIAQEVYEIFPKSISSQEYYSDVLSIPDLLSIDVSQINYSLYGAVKKLMDINKDKERRLKRLECLLNVDSYSGESSNVVIVDTYVYSNVIVNNSNIS